MQAKRCLLFLLLIGSIIASTDGYGLPQAPIGRKREVQKMSTGVLFCNHLIKLIFPFFSFAIFFFFNTNHRFSLFRKTTVSCSKAFV